MSVSTDKDRRLAYANEIREIVISFARDRDLFPEGSPKWKYYQNLIDTGVQDILYLENPDRDLLPIGIAVVLVCTIIIIFSLVLTA